MSGIGRITCPAGVRSTSKPTTAPCAYPRGKGNKSKLASKRPVGELTTVKCVSSNGKSATASSWKRAYPTFIGIPSFRNRSLRIELRIPVESDLSIQTGDGSVETDNNVGSVDIRTGDGHIKVSHAKGAIRLSTGDGHIEATDLNGRLDATSGDGHIQIDGRFDSLKLDTNDGTIDARVLRGSRMANNWSVRTGDGNVTLRLPDDFQANLELHTGDGRIRTDFPIVASGRLGRSDIQGKLNGGGLPLTARTGDGSIHILKY